MSNSKLRWLGLGLVTTAGTGVLALTAMMNSAFAYGDPADPDPSTVGLVMGGSGTPIPGMGYVEQANNLYLGPTLGTAYPDDYPGVLATSGLVTPEGLYPITGVHTLELNYPTDTTPGQLLTGFPNSSTSVGQGLTILYNQIQADIAAGQTSDVFGYSQSSTISSLEMQLLDPSGTPSTDPVNFLLVGDPSNPNGGLLERFDGATLLNGTPINDQLNLPSMGVSFDGATPANDFATTIYTLEYDGFADFPQYPLNFLSDLNAVLGIDTIHGTYLDLTSQQVTPVADGGDAILLPGSALDDAPDSLTNYYMIPETAPLVSLLDSISPQLGALLGPDLTYLINLGYGDGATGYSTGPADVPTPFGLFPDVSLSTVFQNLVTDTEQGISALKSDLADPSALLSSVSDTASNASTSTFSLSDLMSGLAADPSATLTDIVNAFSGAASAAYSALLPTADIINSLVTSMPAYDVGLFIDSLQNGDLLDALGLPFAADTGLVTLAAGFEVDVIMNAISGIESAFAGL
jgi:PE-PPE domain